LRKAFDGTVDPRLRVGIDIAGHARSAELTSWRMECQNDIASRLAIDLTGFFGFVWFSGATSQVAAVN
jgi:hypothetical protein